MASETSGGGGGGGVGRGRGRTEAKGKLLPHFIPLFPEPFSTPATKAAKMSSWGTWEFNDMPWALFPLLVCLSFGGELVGISWEAAKTTAREA